MRKFTLISKGLTLNVESLKAVKPGKIASAVNATAPKDHNNARQPQPPLLQLPAPPQYTTAAPAPPEPEQAPEPAPSASVSSNSHNRNDINSHKSFCLRYSHSHCHSHFLLGLLLLLPLLLPAAAVSTDTGMDTAPGTATGTNRILVILLLVTRLPLEAYQEVAISSLKKGPNCSSSAKRCQQALLMIGHFLGRLSPHATPKQSAELRVGATPALFL